jgi:hypothetical protein
MNILGFTALNLPSSLWWMAVNLWSERSKQRFILLGCVRQLVGGLVLELLAVDAHHCLTKVLADLGQNLQASWAADTISIQSIHTDGPSNGQAHQQRPLTTEEERNMSCGCHVGEWIEFSQ